MATEEHLWDEAYTGNKCIAATRNETYLAVTGPCDVTDKVSTSLRDHSGN